MTLILAPVTSAAASTGSSNTSLGPANTVDWPSALAQADAIGAQAANEATAQPDATVQKLGSQASTGPISVAESPAKLPFANVATANGIPVTASAPAAPARKHADTVTSLSPFAAMLLGVAAAPVSSPRTGRVSSESVTKTSGKTDGRTADTAVGAATAPIHAGPIAAATPRSMADAALQPAPMTTAPALSSTAARQPVAATPGSVGVGASLIASATRATLTSAANAGPGGTQAVTSAVRQGIVPVPPSDKSGAPDVQSAALSASGLGIGHAAATPSPPKLLAAHIALSPAKITTQRGAASAVLDGHATVSGVVSSVAIRPLQSGAGAMSLAVPPVHGASPASVPAPPAIGAGFGSIAATPAALAATITAMHQSGQSGVLLRLDPPDLGTLSVHLALGQSGQVNVLFIPSIVQTGQLLNAGMDALRHAMATSGLTLGQAGVGGQSSGQGASQDGNQNSQTPARPELEPSISAANPTSNAVSGLSVYA